MNTVAKKGTVELDRSALEQHLARLEALAAQMVSAGRFTQPVTTKATLDWSGRIIQLTNAIRSEMT